MSGLEKKQLDKGRAVTVDIDKISKSFGEQKVLHDVSFSVEPGEIFVIMGPSGSGKSVLLKSIIGLETPNSGRVLIAGKDAADPQTHQDIITAIVFQSGALFNSLSVYDNLALYPREHSLFDESVIRSKIKRTLEILSLENAANKFPSELSGGMKKRVAIARSLMMEPQLLLFDEPTSELDPTTAAAITEIIGTLKEEYGVTIIVVSHDRDLSMSIGQRVAVMMDGRVKAIGTPEEIKECSDESVKDFLNPVIDIKNPRFRRK